MSVRPVPSVMLQASCSRFSDWPEYHCSPSLDTPASPFPAPRLPGHAPASPAPCQFRLLCFAFPVSPFPLHPFRFTLHFSRFNPPDPQPRCACTRTPSRRVRGDAVRDKIGRPELLHMAAYRFILRNANRSSSVYPVAPCCGPAHPGRCRSSGTPFRCASSHNG